MASLVWSAHAMGGRNASSIMRYMSPLIELDSEFDILTHSLSDRVLTYLKNAPIPFSNNVSPYIDYYNNDVINMGSWDEVYEKMDVSMMSHYDNLFIIGNILSPKSSHWRFGSGLNHFPCVSYQLNWTSFAYKALLSLAMLKAHKLYNITLHEISYDVMELSLAQYHPDYKPINGVYFNYYGNTIKQYNIQRMDSLQHWNIHHQLKKVKKINKKYDMVCGYTLQLSWAKNRREYVDDIDEMLSNFDDVHFNIWVTGGKYILNTFTTLTEYNNLIEQSLYTYCIPAYDELSLPISRMIDSIERGCIPLLHPSIDIELLNNDFNCDVGFLVRDTPFKTESIRLEHLEYLKTKFCTYERGLVEL